MNLAGMYILCRDPLLIVVGSSGLIPALRIVPHLSTSDRVHIFIQPEWNWESWPRVSLAWKASVKIWLESRLAKHQKVNLHWIVDTKEQKARFKRIGLAAEHCPNTMWIDEQLFPLVDTPFDERPFQAVYLAALREFKRHWLASKIERLKILSYKIESDRFEELQGKWGIAHAVVNTGWIAREFVHHELAQACVGLALSAEEGVMRGNIEYLLSGLPVVSTVSRGGRDQHYTAENHVIVEATAEAVLEGVKLLERRWTPELGFRIREDALGLQKVYRERFVTYVNGVIGRECISTAQVNESFPEQYTAFAEFNERPQKLHSLFQSVSRESQ